MNEYTFLKYLVDIGGGLANGNFRGNCLRSVLNSRVGGSRWVP